VILSLQSMALRLLPPLLVPHLVSRPEYEVALGEAVRELLGSDDNAESKSARHVVVYSTGESTGKSTLVNVALHEIGQALWLSLPHYRHENCNAATVQHEVLLSIAARLRDVLGEGGNSDVRLAVCTSEEIQQYIRCLAVKMEHRRPLLVLDDVEHPSEVALYGYLGLPVVITTRNAAVSPSSRQILVDGFSGHPQLLRSIVIGATGSTDISGPAMRAMERASGNVVSTILLSSIMKGGDLSSLFSGDGTGKSVLGLDECLEIAYGKMSDSEKNHLLSLGALPLNIRVSLALASKLWDLSLAKSKEVAKRLWNRGLLTFTSPTGTPDDDECVFVVHTGVADILVNHVFLREEHRSLLRESLRRITKFLTDPSSFYDAKYDQQLLVFCWNHLLRLKDGFHPLMGPLQAYYTLIAAQQSAATLSSDDDRSAFHVLCERVAVVVNSIDPASYAQCLDQQQNSWIEANKWATVLLTKVLSFHEGGAALHSPNSLVVSSYRVLMSVRPVQDVIDPLFKRLHDVVIARQSGKNLAAFCFLLATCYFQREHFKEAMRELDNADAALGQTLGKVADDAGMQPETVSSLILRAKLLAKMNCPAEINEKILPHIVHLERAAKDSTSSVQERIACTDLLIIFYLELGKSLIVLKMFPKAKKSLEKALSLALKTYEEKHPKVAACLAALLKSCVALKKFDKALPLANKLVRCSRVIFGLEHPASVEANEDLILALKTASQDHQVIPWAKKSLAQAMALEKMRTDQGGHAGHNGKLPSSGFAVRGDQFRVHAQLLLILSDQSLHARDHETARLIVKKALWAICGGQPRKSARSACYDAVDNRTQNQTTAYVKGLHFTSPGTLPGRLVEISRLAIQAYNSSGIDAIIAALDFLVANSISEEVRAIFQSPLDYLVRIKDEASSSSSSSSSGEQLIVILAESLRGATNYLLSLGEHDAANQLLQQFSCTPPEKMESLRCARLEEEAKRLEKASASAASAKVMEKFFGVVSAAAHASTSSSAFDASALKIQEAWHRFKERRRTCAANKVQCAWRGAFVRMRIMRLQSSLLGAISRSDIPMMKALLEQGAIVNARNCQNRGATPLAAACMLGANAGVVKLLMQSGADAQKADIDGFFPLILASRGGHLGIVGELLREGKGKVSPDQADISNTTSLHVAARCGHSEVVALLVGEFQANVAAVDCDGFNAAHLASLNGYTDLVSFLLDRGINLNQTNHHGDSCLILACLGGHASVVSLLLQRGCSRRLENSDGLSAVDIAAYKENTTLLFLLTHDEDAATKVQSLWRRFRVRRLHGAILEKRLFEVRILRKLVSAQSACRAFLAKKVVVALRLADIRKRADAYMSQRQREAALIIMRKWLQRFRRRKVIQQHLDDMNRIAKSFDVTRFEHFETLRSFSIAAVRIQRGWRIIFKTRTQNALVLQRFWRRYSGGYEGKRREDAWFVLLRKNLPLLLKQAEEVNDHQRAAATRIQKVWRNFLYRDMPLSHRANSYDLVTLRGCTELLLSLRARAKASEEIQAAASAASERKDSPVTPVVETTMLRRRATIQQQQSAATELDSPSTGSAASFPIGPMPTTPQANTSSVQRFDAFQVFVKTNQKKKARVGRSSSTSSKWSLVKD